MNIFVCVCHWLALLFLVVFGGVSHPDLCDLLCRSNGRVTLVSAQPSINCTMNRNQAVCMTTQANVCSTLDVYGFWLKKSRRGEGPPAAALHRNTLMDVEEPSRTGQMDQCNWLRQGSDPGQESQFRVFATLTWIIFKLGSLFLKYNSCCYCYRFLTMAASKLWEFL